MGDQVQQLRNLGLKGVGLLVGGVGGGWGIGGHNKIAKTKKLGVM
jgi:hypothetical protein